MPPKSYLPVDTFSLNLTDRAGAHRQSAEHGTAVSAATLSQGKTEQDAEWEEENSAKHTEAGEVILQNPHLQQAALNSSNNSMVGYQQAICKMISVRAVRCYSAEIEESFEMHGMLKN